ncbi:hypothetical protein VTL71DRAFT_1941 [Oculimacula yallundae]|uniref:Uncharacterized protein n=1 Tax=Oculimacula yallundae TaxID=86028 RepID=A0ABR4CE30_9HELO
MAHRILITGAARYLGGDFIARLPDAKLPPYEKLYAFIRTDEEAEFVQQCGAEPLRLATYDAEGLRNAVVENGITIVFWLIEVVKEEGPVIIINALAEVKASTGKAVHFIHTTTVKTFSNLAGAPINGTMSDTSGNLYKIQKKIQKEQAASFECRQNEQYGHRAI